MTMPRYIDAEKVEKWSWQEPRYSDSINDRTDLRDFLKSLPTVSHDEVRGVGKWINKTMSVPNGHGQTYNRWGCSVCKAKFKLRTNYCPSCGARMKGAEDGN